MADSNLHVELRFLLNAWDPIGVADVVEDECDCLIAPLLLRLNAGVGRTAVREFLWRELEDQFGLNPVGADVDGVADRLVAWWSARAGSTGPVTCPSGGARQTG